MSSKLKPRKRFQNTKFNRIQFNSINRTPSLFDGSSGEEIKKQFNQLNEHLTSIHIGNLKAQKSVEEIAKLEMKCYQDKATRNNSSKELIRNVYTKAMEDAKEESDLIRKTLNDIVQLRQMVKMKKKLDSSKSCFLRKGPHLKKGQVMKLLYDTAITLPLFIPSNIHEKAPPLCGSKPAPENHIIGSGELVAVPVENKDFGSENEPNHNWILGEVINYDSDKCQYIIEDIDEQHKVKHYISQRKVVALPKMRANPETDPDAIFPKGALVLALYPQTTCFYRGIVQDIPKGPNDLYRVMFEDLSYKEGYSPPMDIYQRYVVSHVDWDD